MAVNHLLSLQALEPEELARLVGRSVELAKGVRERPLEDRVVGIYFRKSSTRTRTSFSVGAMKLGAQIIAYGPQDLQLVTGETLEDTARVLNGYLDALVIRTNDPVAEMEVLAQQEEMAIVNAMSAEEHPTQAIADLSTLQEHFGRLRGLHLAYLGEGNNSASALAYAFGMLPEMRLTLLTPAGYGLPEETLERARKSARRSGSCIEQYHDLERLPAGVDAVYTTRWHTMGVPKPDPDWREMFRPFTVTTEVMERASKPDGGTIFMHDLPAVRGDDVEDAVLDGPQSKAWRQARHKLFGAMAVLEWCVTGGERPSAVTGDRKDDPT